MNQEIIMSIRPQHFVNILNGKKTIELRKRFPSDYRGWVFAYCTLGKPYLADFGDNEYPYKNGGYDWDLDLSNIEKHDAEVLNGKVVCRFWVDNVEEIVLEDISGNEQYNIVFENHTTKETEDKLKSMCLTFDEFLDYHLKSLAHKKDGFVVSKAIHISKLKIFDKPKDLTEFYYYKKRLIDCGMDCPPYFDEVKTQVRKAPQSYMYVEVEDDSHNQ
jgi:hypothetical protein